MGDPPVSGGGGQQRRPVMRKWWRDSTNFAHDPSPQELPRTITPASPLPSPTGSASEQHSQDRALRPSGTSWYTA
jgi:hypothetical protein